MSVGFSHGQGLVVVGKVSSGRQSHRPYDFAMQPDLIARKGLSFEEATSPDLVIDQTRQAHSPPVVQSCLAET
jgi:hypothetical protein